MAIQPCSQASLIEPHTSYCCINSSLCYCSVQQNLERLEELETDNAELGTAGQPRVNVILPF